MDSGTANLPAHAPRRPFRCSIPAAVVVVAMVAYMAIFSWFSIGRAANYNAGWYDLGIMSQTVWRVGHGLGFTFTNPEAGPGGVHGLETPRSAIHSDYLLVLLAPLSWFGATWQNLLVLQTVILAAGAWFVFRLGRTLLGSPWRGMLIALAYLAYSPLQFANLFDFHAVTLSVTFFLGAADAIVHGRHRWFWVWAGLALITKEQVGITLGLLGGALYLWRRDRRRALWAAVIPWAWVLAQLFVAIPLSRPGQDSHFIFQKFYGSEGLSSSNLLKTLLDPHRTWQLLATRTHLNDALQLAAPLGLVLPLLSPFVLLALPEVLLYWLWDTPNPQTLFFHYHALFIPFLFLSCLFGWRVMERGMARFWPSGRRWVRLLWVVLLVAGTALSIWRYSPWPWSPISRWKVVAWREHQSAQVQAMLRLVPPDATVAVTQNLGLQVSGRARVTLLPTGATTERYLVILQRSFDATTKTDAKRYAERDMLEQLLAWVQSQPTAYAIRYHSDRVWLIERIGQPTRPEPTWPAGLLGQ